MDNPKEFFTTPFGLIEGCLRAVEQEHNAPRLICDAGAGTGHWGLVARSLFPAASIYGVDDYFTKPHTGWYDDWHHGDYFSDWSLLAPKFNWVIGNPPYKQILPWVEKSLQIIESNGIVALLTPITVGNVKKFNRITRDDLAFHKICFVQPRPSFTGNGVTAVRTEYGLYMWRNNRRYNPVPHGFVNWDRGRNMLWEAKFNALEETNKSS